MTSTVRSRTETMSRRSRLPRWELQRRRLLSVRQGSPRRARRRIVGPMKGDRVEAVVDTGQGVQTFEIVATRAGRRIEVVTSRGVVEVREVTRTGTPVRTGRFMTSRLIALVEHPAIDERGRVEVTTRHRLQARDRA